MALPALLISLLLLAWLLAIALCRRRTMPAGLSMASSLQPADNLNFLVDLTWQQENGPVSQQQILPALLTMIEEAESFIIVDIFLYNDLHDKSRPVPALCRMVTNALLVAKKKRPGLTVWLLSDPVNTGYGSYPNPYFQELEAGGIIVLPTNLELLPDSNLLYSPLMNLLGGTPVGRGPGRLPSPFYAQAPCFSLAGWLALFHFKANHRKVVLTDKAGLICSANPSHDASGANSNIAFTFSGPLLNEILKSEQAVAALSHRHITVPQQPAAATNGTDRPQIQLLTEGKIKEALLADIDGCATPATLWLAMFYLSDHQIIAALLRAAGRGMTINLILDANRDAFGRRKNGVPNKPVAALLRKKSAGGIHIRWYNSQSEQFHTKLILLSRTTGSIIMGGSANLTRRNIGDFNLESSLRIACSPHHSINRQVHAYFEDLWYNNSGTFTVPYQQLADPCLFKYWQYQFQERTGFSLF